MTRSRSLVLGSQARRIANPRPSGAGRKLGWRAHCCAVVCGVVRNAGEEFGDVAQAGKAGCATEERDLALLRSRNDRTRRERLNFCTAARTSTSSASPAQTREEGWYRQAGVFPRPARPGGEEEVLGADDGEWQRIKQRGVRAKPERRGKEKRETDPAALRYRR